MSCSVVWFVCCREGWRETQPTDAAELEETYCRKSCEEKHLPSSGLGPDLCRNASAQKKERVTANGQPLGCDRPVFIVVFSSELHCLTLTATQNVAALRFGEKFSLARAMLTTWFWYSFSMFSFTVVTLCRPLSTCRTDFRVAPVTEFWACVGLTHIDRASLFWVLSISSLVSVFVESS